MSQAKEGSKANEVTTFQGIVLTGLVAAIALCAWYVRPGLNWILIMGLMVAFMVVLGYALTKRALGILINEDKCMSLSRFQMVLWTVIVISGFFAVAIARVKAGDVADPLAVQVDWQVWALLGISATSLVGSPLVRSTKESKDPKPEVIEQAGTPYGDDIKEVNTLRRGVIYPNKDPSEARITDMFEGEELSNASLIDLGKVQMFFFTVIVAMAYCVEFYDLIALRDLTEDDISLPKIHEGLLTLMGISNVAYLGAKGAPQTPTA